MKSTQYVTIFRLSSRHVPELISLIVLMFVLGSCTPQYVDPLSLDVTARDKQEAPFPPTDEELSVSPHLLLSLVTFKDSTVTDARMNAVMKFVQSAFEKYANFSAIPMSKVDELLSAEENRRFQASNVADAIQLGNSLQAAFVAQFQIMIAESKVVKNIDHYTASVNLTIFTTDSGQVVFKKDIAYDTTDPEASEKDLKKLVQEYFPLRGYILETRGDRQYGKISLGRSLGVKIGREFQIRDRVVKNEIVMGISRRTVSFSSLALATVKVIKVMEDASWVAIGERDRDLVMKGQVVFSRPEKSSIYY